MKIFKGIMAVGALLLSAGALTSCSSDGSSASADGALAGASQGDSLMYYFGQTRAGEFWQQAKSDTTLAGEAATKDFMRGVRAGMDAVRESAAYNLGVFQGVQLALNLKEFHKEFPDVQLNNDVMLRAMNEGMKSDSAINYTEAQKALYAIIGQLEEQKEAAERVASASALPAQAQRMGMTKVSDILYSKTTAPGNGKKFNPGEKVTTSMTLATTGGRTLSVPLPSEVVIGRRYVSPLVSEALATLTQGGAGEFLTSAYAMFGKRCERLNLRPDESLILTIRTGAASNDTTSSAVAAEMARMARIAHPIGDTHPH